MAPGFSSSCQSDRALHCTVDALFADSQFGNHFAISLDVVPSQVIEQAAALADNLQQAAPGRMIFLVCLEMLGQVRDSFAQNCNLNFRGPRIGGMDRYWVMMFPFFSFVKLIRYRSISFS